MAIREDLTEFESSLELRRGFLPALAEEDDWSFIIKAHALLEAGVSQLLVHELGRPELEEIFSRLDIAAAYFGNSRSSRRSIVSTSRPDAIYAASAPYGTTSYIASRMPKSTFATTCLPFHRRSAATCTSL